MKRLYIYFYSIACVALLLGGMTACNGRSSSSEHDHEHSGHNHEAEHGEIELSEKQMKTVGIELGSFDRREIGSGMRANGFLAVNPQDVAEISPLLSGVVKQINVKEGDFVNKGTTVAVIENLDIVTYNQDYQIAVDELELAQSELERQNKLAEQGAGIKRNLEKARTDMKIATARVSALERQLRQAGITPGSAIASTGTAAVKAPIGGIVSVIFAKTGGFADMSTPIMTVTDNRKIFALLKVYEKDIDKIEKGQKVDLNLTNGAMRLEGVVAEINRTIDPETKGIDVRVALTGANLTTLIPGMAVTGYIRSGGTETDALPEDAVVSSGGKSYIYVLEGTEEEDGELMYHFEPVEVITGNREQGFIEVSPLTELTPDAKIVIAKAFYLASMAADHGEHNH
ncbi:MAG: efflux RND transporter periplasmic adaptor subunit [Paramuribaculum sp.]|nr:efflux RND transporter periplasmic adaptor subunit [Paramuribaculum sp.]